MHMYAINMFIATYVPNCEARVFKFSKSSFIEKDWSIRKYTSNGKLLAGRTETVKFCTCPIENKIYACS